MEKTEKDKWIGDLTTYIKQASHHNIDCEGYLRNKELSREWIYTFSPAEDLVRQVGGDFDVFWNKYDYYQSVDLRTRNEIERSILKKLPEIMPDNYLEVNSIEGEKLSKLLKRIDEELSLSQIELRDKYVELLFAEYSDRKEIYLENFWRKKAFTRTVKTLMRHEVNWIVLQRLKELDTKEFEMLSPEEMKTLKAYLDKPFAEVTGEMAKFFTKKRNLSALFDRRYLPLRVNVMHQFWTEQYPELKKIFKLCHIVVSQVQLAVMEILRSVEKQQYDKVLKNLLKWAEDNGEKPSFEALRLFLRNEGLENTPSRFQKELLADFERKMQ